MKIKFLLITCFVAFIGLTTSCSDDDYSPAPPQITFPSTGNPQVIAPGETINFTFTVSAPRGYGSHILNWTSGTVNENTVNIPTGQNNFEISGTFTAGEEFTGPGGITLSVSDTEGSTSFATIAVVVE